jgi:hypothetical protein
MDATNILVPSAFDVNNIVFGNYKSGKFCGSVDVGYLPDSKLYLELPRMHIPFQSKMYDGKYNNFCIAFEKRPELKNEKSVGILVEKLRDLETRIVAEAVENASVWFGTTIKDAPNAEAVKRMFRPMLVQTSQVYAPYMTVKVGYTFGSNPSITTNFFGSNEKAKLERIETPNLETLLARNNSVRSIVVCKGIWIRENTFGVTWQAEQVQVFANKSNVATTATTSNNYIHEKIGSKMAEASSVSDVCEFGDSDSD